MDSTTALESHGDVIDSGENALSDFDVNTLGAELGEDALGHFGGEGLDEFSGALAGELSHPFGDGVVVDGGGEVVLEVLESDWHLQDNVGPEGLEGGSLFFRDADVDGEVDADDSDFVVVHKGEGMSPRRMASSIKMRVGSFKSS